ncbi:ganglioside GM2 activator [Brachionichthys hirsutus]|uniref:ganglioside GM2 activator n=1 Tax=Brachionichthys hirsutus TaxID=412623 RepID=UPI003604F094
MGRLFVLTVGVAVGVAVGLVVLTPVNGGSAGENKDRRIQLLGFGWKDCGQPGDPAVLGALTVSPDPIRIPGSLTASASGATAVDLSAPLSLNVTLEKEVLGFWVTVPCLDQLGSCHYQDACDVLNQLIPAGQDCPEPLHTYGLPCHCPFKTGSYFLPRADFYVPHIDLPHWLTNGDYRAQGVLGARGRELGCVSVSLSVHAD